MSNLQHDVFRDKKVFNPRLKRSNEWMCFRVESKNTHKDAVSHRSEARLARLRLAAHAGGGPVPPGLLSTAVTRGPLSLGAGDRSGSDPTPLTAAQFRLPPLHLSLLVSVDIPSACRFSRQFLLENCFFFFPDFSFYFKINHQRIFSVLVWSTFSAFTL